MDAWKSDGTSGSVFTKPVGIFIRLAPDDRRLRERRQNTAGDLPNNSRKSVRRVTKQAHRLYSHPLNTRDLKVETSHQVKKI